MQANTLTPQKLFEHQVRYVIPVFQRPYVWKVKKQWEPLWDDVRHVAEELLDASATATAHPVPPHFLGAVVLDQQLGPAGYIAVRHVIDGQQRLITLQLLLNAVRQVAAAYGRPRDAALLATLVRNPEHVIDTDDELLKVWPIVPDREPFIHAMDDDHGNDDGGLKGEFWPRLRMWSGPTGLIVKLVPGSSGPTKVIGGGCRRRC